MGKTTEGAIWGLPVVPRDVESFLTVCRTLNALEEIIREDRLRALERVSALPVGTIHLEDDALASILVRLSKRPWRSLILSDSSFRRDVARILGHLKTKLKRERGPAAVHSSLVARRLILFCSAGCSPFSRTDMEDYCDGWFLPPPWSDQPLSVAPSLQQAVSSKQLLSTSWRVRRFLEEAVVYWAEAPADHHAARGRRNDGEVHPQNEPHHFHSPQHQRRIVQLPYVLEPNTDEPAEMVHVPNVRFKMFAATAAAGSAMAPSHRNMPAALRLMSALESDPKDPSLTVGHLRMVTFGALSTCTGLPFKKLLGMGLGRYSRDGGIFSDHMKVEIGTFGSEMGGRISPQMVMLPIPTVVAAWVQVLIERYGPSVDIGTLFPRDPIGTLLVDLGRYLDRPVREVEFLHRAFDYVALVEERIHPGVFALLTGRPCGPYRSDTSYISVMGELLWAQATGVQDKLLRFAGVKPGGTACPAEFRQSRVGAECMNLAECREPLIHTLGCVANADQAAAACEIRAQLHGRRPTNDRPHPNALRGPIDTYLFSDKNHGGGRRMRIVPQIRPGELP